MSGSFKEISRSIRQEIVTISVVTYHFSVDSVFRRGMVVCLLISFVSNRLQILGQHINKLFAANGLAYVIITAHVKGVEECKRFIRDNFFLLAALEFFPYPPQEVTVHAQLYLGFGLIVFVFFLCFWFRKENRRK